MDKLIQESNHGLEAHTAIHADKIRTSAFSTKCVGQQDEIINQFSTETFLKLNSGKLEIVKKLRRLDSQENNSILFLFEIEMPPHPKVLNVLGCGGILG